MPRSLTDGYNCTIRNSAVARRICVICNGIMADLKLRRSLCYHDEFETSASRDLGISRATPRIGVRWGPSHINNTPLSLMGCLIAVGQTVRAYVYRELLEILDHPGLAVQYHSRSSEMTCIDRVPATSYINVGEQLWPYLV